jgi:hypothetical protein
MKLLKFYAKLLFYIPLHTILDFGIRISEFKYWNSPPVGFGGETASTGTKKLRLHTEHSCLLVNPMGT